MASAPGRTPILSIPWYMVPPIYVIFLTSVVVGKFRTWKWNRKAGQ